MYQEYKKTGGAYIGSSEEESIKLVSDIIYLARVTKEKKRAMEPTGFK